MKTSHIIVSAIHVLFFFGGARLFSKLSAVLGLLSNIYGVIILSVVILIPLIWGVINAINYLRGKPLALRQLKGWEKILALFPLVNLLIIIVAILLVVILN